MTCSTLTEGLEAVRQKNHRIFFIDAKNKHQSITFAALYQRALGLLGQFLERGLKAGDELIISTDNNLAFIDAFWACQLGGIIPVPISPGISAEQHLKLFRVYRLLRNPYLYTDHQTGARIRNFKDRLGADTDYAKLKARTILIENITNLGQPANPRLADPEDVSFIQFSSGSTSDPKGVVLTHRNLTINIHDIHAAVQLRDGDRSLSWMPLTHDMGLIGFHLAMVIRGITHYIMDTSVFVRRPTAWLQTACQEKTSILCSPNFGYRLFLKAFNRWKIEDLDLSHVRLIFNGAEPISASLCEEFIGTLTPFGLKPSAMVPVYGLAEASLAVSFSDLNDNYSALRLRRESIGMDEKVVETLDNNAITIVEVGQPVSHCAVRITNSDGNTVAPEHVGRIEIKGPNVTQGYYASPAPDRSAYTDDDWFDTGDAGFIKDGRLFITGRIKDVMFVNGQNFYAHDLENIACELPYLDPGKIVVCAVPDEHESADTIAVFVMHAGDYKEFCPVIADVRRIIGERTGAEITHVIPVTQIPKTTSGKLQRYALRQSYLNGEFNEFLATNYPSPHTIQGHTEMEDTLLDICASSLGGVKLERNDNFFEIGMNSLKLVEMHELIDQRFPSQLEISDLFKHPTLAQLAAFLQSKQ